MCKTCNGSGWIMNDWSPTGYPLVKCPECTTGKSKQDEKKK
jgi:hypothetical protein